MDETAIGIAVDLFALACLMVAILVVMTHACGICPAREEQDDDY